MPENFLLAAQLSTGHSPPEALNTSRVKRRLHEALTVAPLDMLILGWVEISDLFQELTAEGSRLTKQVFLWYPLLSDYPGLEPNHLVLNYKGVPSQGWGEFVEKGGMSETFRFACPNNPAAQQTTLQQLARLLTTYDFDGLFLDKFRFPSPANGLDELLSCFCIHCQQAAKESGFDLKEVQTTIENLPHLGEISTAVPRTPGQWLADLLAEQPLLQAFVAFRADSITRLVAKVQDLVDRLGKKLALDLFSPSLAMLVGQDYLRLAQYTAWAKPMIYRFARGPAGLRLEIPALAGDLESLLGCPPDTGLDWIQRRVPGLSDTTFADINDEGAPLKLIADETRLAVNLLTPAPVYLGLETVSMPGVIDITPKHVEEIVRIGRAAGISGVVLSWDLMHTPLENLKPLGANS